MNDDAVLLSRYAVDHSESAFAELIGRHVDLVYSAALRVGGGDVHRAQDLTQQVFLELARQAKDLRQHPALAGWLYTTTRRMALRTARAEQRRKIREQAANVMNELLREAEPEPDWDQLSPILDEAMHALGEKDRFAVLLRFFQNKSLKEIGLALGLSENAARMRVDRALDKLRAQLAHRGLTSTAAALALKLAANAVAATPPAFVATLTSATLTQAAVGSGATLTFLKIMTLTKLQSGLIGMVAVASVATSLVIQHQSQTQLRAAGATMQQQADQLARLRAETGRYSNILARAKGPHLNTADELRRLQTEAAILQQQTNTLAGLQADNRRLRSQLAQQPNKPKTALEMREEGIAKLIYCKDWFLAFTEYAEKNQGQFPTNFAQAASFLPDEAKGEAMLATDQYEILYNGPKDAINSPSKIIVMREKQAWQTPDGKWMRAYGFADGHSEIHSSPDGNYEPWEKQHLVASPNP